MPAKETNDGFQFYLRFAKPLVLNLSSPKERVLAAAWVQKLTEEQFGTEKARTDHLKLLLFVLQKGKLFGPFVNNPGQHDKIEEYPLPIKLRDIAKSWVEGEDNRKKARLLEGFGSSDFPPLTTECSADLLEYVAAQDIPNFGIHAYYAISTEPINTWENLEKGVFPKGALSAVRKSESANVSAAASARRSRSRSRSKSRSRTADDLDGTARERSSVAQVTFQDGVGDQPFPGRAKAADKISSPLGSPPPPARTSPTWGSNLISVGDPPSPEGMAFAPPKNVASGTDKPPSKMSIKGSTAYAGTPPVRRQLDFSDLDRTDARSPARPKLSFAEPSPKTSTPVVELYLPSSGPDVGEAPSLPYQTPPGGRTWDLSQFDTSPAAPVQIPRRLSFASPSPRTSTPMVSTFYPPLPQGEVSDIFGEEAPSFLDDEDTMITSPAATRARFEEAPSLPYKTPPWDMSAPSLPYQTPPGGRTWDLSQFDTSPAAPVQIPRRLSFASPSPRTSTPMVSTFYPPLPQGEVSDIFGEEAPSFLDDEDTMITSPAATRARFEEAPSLPYQTPPGGRTWDLSQFDTSPAAPVQIPARLSFASPSPRTSTPVLSTFYPPLPEGEVSDIFGEETPSFLADEDIMMTPPAATRARLQEAPSLPYQTPPWDMSAASVPYRTPEWDMSAPSIPYRTPPYDPFARAEAQYASLPARPKPRSKIPRMSTRPATIEERPFAEQPDDLSAMERVFDSEDMSESTEEFSFLEKWAAGPSETPPKEIPRKSAAREVQEILAQGIRASPAAQDIVDEAVQQMSMIGEEDIDMEQLYAEQDSAYPHRRRGTRTPPVFSRSERIRQAGRHIRYNEPQFGITEPVDWRPAEDVLPSETLPTSPREDLRKKYKTRPFEELFPGVDIPMDYVPFDEDDEIDLVDEELLIRSPKKRDLQRRIQDILGEIDRIEDEVPALGGIGVTTPKRSPSPVRPDRQDDYDDLFFFLEKPPEGFAMSPEDYMSPASKANAQYAALQEQTPSPRRLATPPPMETPEFLRKKRMDEELGICSPAAEVEVRAKRPKPPRTKSKKRKRKQEKPAPESEEEYESEEEIFGKSKEEIEQLYQSLVEEEERVEQRPRTPRSPQPQSPPPRTPPPVPHYSPPALQKVHYEIPPKFEPSEAAYKTPPRRLTREEFPEGLEFEEEPAFEEPWLSSPPTPPAPFEYESPQYTPLDDYSPPLKELLEAHEFTEDFFDPQRPHARKSVMLRGKRVPIQRHSRPPALSPIPDYLEDIYASPPSGRGFERALEMAAQFAPPTPEEPAVCPSRAQAPEASKQKPKKKSSKGKLPKTRSKSKLKGSKTGAKTPARAPTPPRQPSPVAGPSRERTPPRPTSPLQIERPVLGPLTRREHYYAQSFSDPKQRELMLRVERIIADVGSPILESPERDEFEHIPGQIDLDVSPPPYGPLEEELPDLSPQPPPSPPLSPRQFDFETDQSDFMTPPQAWSRAPSPERMYTPRERERTPPPCEFEPFPFIPPDDSGEYDMFDITPPSDLLPPSPARSPESPEIDPLIFEAEMLEARSPRFRDQMHVRPSPSGRVHTVRRRSGPSGLSRVREVPETEEFQQLLPFHERIEAAAPSRRRTVRAGTRKLQRRSAAPGLGAVSEHIEYPASPLTTRTPGTPHMAPITPRPRPVIEESEQLIDVPCGPCGTPEDTRPRPSKLRRKVQGRRIDFGPTPPRPGPAAVPEEEGDIYGPAPEDLMGVHYPIQFESREETIIDSTPPGHLPSPTIRPSFKLDWWETPPHLKKQPSPKKEFEWRMKPQLRDVLDFQSPIALPPSPEPLPEEEEFDFPLATAMGGFPATPPASPYEFSPSPKREFGRQITPEGRRQGTARLVTPPREIRPPAPGLLAAHRQYQSLLMDTPPEAAAGVCPGASSRRSSAAVRRQPTPPRRVSPVAGPSTRIETTSETIISPTQRKITTTKKTISPAPVTPPMMIPGPRRNIFMEDNDVDLFSEEMPEFMEPSPEEQMRRGMIQAPLRTTRRPTQLYGYGERKLMKLERKQKPPCLGTVAESADEPRDEYVYWPGPHVPPPPSAMYSGGRLGPAVYPCAAPSSARGVRAPTPGLDYHEFPPRKPKPRQPPPTLSPPQIRRRQRIPRPAMTARRRLEFEDAGSPKTYMEHLESMVADVPIPEDLEVPQLPSPAYIDFQPPAWSPPPIGALESRDMMGLDIEPPSEFEEFQSPRTPRESPGLPFVDTDEQLGQYSPPIGMSDISPVHTPLGEYSPPPDMEGLDEFEVTPPSPCGVSPTRTSPSRSPAELQRRVQEHEYTMHKGDTTKRHLSKYIHVKGRPYEVRKSQAPCLGPVEERPEPGYAREEQLLDITPPARDPMADVMDAAARQYAMLRESPEEERHITTEARTTADDYILDEPLGLQMQMALPLPVTEEFQWESPEGGPPINIPRRYVPPPPTSPERFDAMAPYNPDYLLDYMESPPLIGTPPRDIFAEAMEMDWPEEDEDIDAFLTGSPVGRTPPDRNHTLPSKTDIEKQQQEELTSSPYNVTTPHTSTNPFNDLAYCIEKGLDYFPVKGDDMTPVDNHLGLENTFYMSLTKLVNKILIDSPSINKLENVFCTASIEKFIFAPNMYLQFSEYIVAFHQYLYRENSDSESTPPPNIPTRVETPRSIEYSQMSPNFPRQHLLVSPRSGRSPTSNCSSSGCKVKKRGDHYELEPYSSSEETSVINMSYDGRIELPLTMPRRPPVNFQRPLAASTSNSLSRNADSFDRPQSSPGRYRAIDQSQLNRTSDDYSFEASGFRNLPSSTPRTTRTRPRKPDQSRTCTEISSYASARLGNDFRNMANLRTSTPISASRGRCPIAFRTLPGNERQVWENTTADFRSLPYDLNSSSQFDTLPNRSQNIFANTTTDFQTLPNVRRCNLEDTTSDFRRLPTHSNISSQFDTLPNRSQNIFANTTTDFQTLPNVRRCNLEDTPSDFRTLPTHSNISSQFDTLPNRSQNIFANTTTDFQTLPNVRRCNLEDTTSDIRTLPTHSNISSHFETLPNRTQNILENTTADFQTLPNSRRCNLGDTTSNFRTLPGHSNVSSHFETLPNRAQNILGNTTTDFQTLPNLRRCSLGNTTSNFRTLPTDTNISSRVETLPNRSRNTLANATADFNTLPRESPSGRRYCSQTSRNDTRECPAGNCCPCGFQTLPGARTNSGMQTLPGRSIGITTVDFQTLPNETRRSTSDFPDYALQATTIDSGGHDTTFDYHTLGEEAVTSTPRHSFNRFQEITQPSVRPLRDTTYNVTLPQNTFDRDYTRNSGSLRDSSMRHSTGTVCNCGIPVSSRSRKISKKCSPRSSRTLASSPLINTTNDLTANDLTADSTFDQSSHVQELPVNRRLFSPLTAPKLPGDSSAPSQQNYENEIIEDVSQHINNLSANVSSVNGLTHLIISGIGPLYATSIPSSSADRGRLIFTSMRPGVYKAIEGGLSTPQSKRLNRSSETQDKYGTSETATGTYKTIEGGLSTPESKRLNRSSERQDKYGTSETATGTYKAIEGGLSTPESKRLLNRSSETQDKYGTSETATGTDERIYIALPIGQDKESTNSPEKSPIGDLTPSRSVKSGVGDTPSKTGEPLSASRTVSEQTKIIAGKESTQATVKYQGSKIQGTPSKDKASGTPSKTEMTTSLSSSKEITPSSPSKTKTPSSTSKMATSSSAAKTTASTSPGERTAPLSPSKTITPSSPSKTTTPLSSSKITTPSSPPKTGATSADISENASPENEDFVRNIPLDETATWATNDVNDKEKSEKNESACTDETCADKPPETDLCIIEDCAGVRDACPSAACKNDTDTQTETIPRYDRPQYFKNSPCLDISLPVQCTNPYCGGLRNVTAEETDEMILEDWADPLVNMDGNKSVQTQYYDMDKRASHASGCCCERCS